MNVSHKHWVLGLGGLLFIIVVIGLFALIPSSPSNSQKSLCEVNQWRHNIVAKKCKPGQKVAFLPDRWGNDQLPILFVAVNCDLNYSVAMNNGGVTCVYGPITPRTSE